MKYVTDMTNEVNVHGTHMQENAHILCELDQDEICRDCCHLRKSTTDATVRKIFVLPNIKEVNRNYSVIQSKITKPNLMDVNN